MRISLQFYNYESVSLRRPILSNKTDSVCIT